MNRKRFAITAAFATVALSEMVTHAADGCRRKCRCISGRGCCDVRYERHQNGSCVPKRYRCGVNNTRCDCAGGCL